MKLITYSSLLLISSELSDEASPCFDPKALSEIIRELLKPSRPTNKSNVFNTPLRPISIFSNTNVQTEPDFEEEEDCDLEDAIEFDDDDEVEQPEEDLDEDEIIELAPELSQLMPLTERRPSYRFGPSFRLIPNDLLESPVNDIEESMKMMDKLYNAGFAEFIRQEENLVIIVRHLKPIVKDYSLLLVANALRWVMDGWLLENIAKLLKLMTKEWPPESCGTLVNMLTFDWSGTEVQNDRGTKSVILSFPKLNLKDFYRQIRRPAVSETPKIGKTAQMKLVAILTCAEPAEVSAIFIKYLTHTENWTQERATELVSFLDSVLEWNDEFFRQFTHHYMQVSHEDETLNQSLSQSKISFEYLAALYKTNIAMANYKLALADFKLAMATRNLNLARDLQQQGFAPPEAENKENEELIRPSISNLLNE